jgi:hypothetical protein
MIACRWLVGQAQQDAIYRAAARERVVRRVNNPMTRPAREA